MEKNNQGNYEIIEKIEINGKTYDLYFGLDCLAFLDNLYGQRVDKENFISGKGLLWNMSNLLEYSTQALAELIVGATITEPKSKQPTKREIEEYIAAELDRIGAADLFTNFINACTQAPLMRPTIQRYVNPEDLQKGAFELADRVKQRQAEMMKNNKTQTKTKTKK